MIVTGKVPIRVALFDQQKQLAIVLIVSLVVMWVRILLGQRWVSIQVLPLTALGVALGVFLSLRNNIVWSRYWEGRSHWGRLINLSRTLPRQLATLVNPGAGRDVLLREQCHRQIAFVKAFRSHLRDEDPIECLHLHLPDEEIARLRHVVNVPSAILQRTGETLYIASEQGLLSELDLLRIDSTMTDITDVLGGCEKIKNTPLPPAYTYLAHRIVLFYCCMLPFSLASDLGVLTPFLTIFISFAFLTLDRTSDLIEQPFAREDNDLPLDAMTRTIERDLLQAAGETDIPPPIKPVNGILL
jgi:putative membrane protein